MDRKSLDEILDDDEGEVVDTTPEPEPSEPEATEPKGVEPEPEKEPEPEPPSGGLPKDVYEPLKAVRSENQQLKDQLEALRKEAEARQQPKEPEAPPPSIWEDDQAWEQHFSGQLVSKAVQAATNNSRLQMSEMMMAQQHEDFPQIKDKLMEFVGNNPVINQQVAESQHPWSTAYNAWKNHETMQQLGATDLETLREQIRQEELAKLQEELPAPKQSAPKTLASKRSVASRGGPAWNGPRSLDELLD